VSVNCQLSPTAVSFEFALSCCATSPQWYIGVSTLQTLVTGTYVSVIQGHSHVLEMGSPLHSPSSFYPLPSPSFPSPSLPFPLYLSTSFPSSPPLPFPPLKSRPHIAARGSGERISSPSGLGWSLTAKRFLVNFKQKLRI